MLLSTSAAEFRETARARQPEPYKQISLIVLALHKDLSKKPVKALGGSWSTLRDPTLKPVASSQQYTDELRKSAPV